MSASVRMLSASASVSVRKVIRVVMNSPADCGWFVPTLPFPQLVSIFSFSSYFPQSNIRPFLYYNSSWCWFAFAFVKETRKRRRRRRRGRRRRRRICFFFFFSPISNQRTKAAAIYPWQIACAKSRKENIAPDNKNSLCKQQKKKRRRRRRRRKKTKTERGKEKEKDHGQHQSPPAATAGPLPTSHTHTKRDKSLRFTPIAIGINWQIFPLSILFLLRHRSQKEDIRHWTKV